MDVRSMALFGHLLGMLVLFVGLAAEWQSLESIRSTHGDAAPPLPVTILRTVPRLTGIAAALILLTGIYLAAGTDAWTLAWVPVAFTGMVLMAVLGGTALRPVTRALRLSDAMVEVPAPPIRRLAAHPFLRASLRVRAGVALAIVYLMVAKPDLPVSITAVMLGVVIGLASGWLRVNPSTAIPSRVNPQ